MEHDGHHRAALGRLRRWGDPILRTSTVPVTTFDAELRALAAELATLLDAAEGAGLAAPQAGSVRRLFVYRFDDADRIQALVNPRLTWASPERQRGLEGCLSIPDVALEVERALAVTVVGNALDGAALTLEAEGPDAVLLQHELDHLDGVLMLDRAEPAERRRAVRALRERQLG